MSEKVPTRIKVFYGVGDAGVAMLTAIIQFYLLFFYTDVARINPAIVGTALLVGKLTWDAFNDLFFGYLSDRTKSRWGRRRPYLLFLAVPLGLVTWMLFSIPQGLTGVTAFLVVLFSFLIFDTVHTFIGVAYSALTPELTQDYDERTSLTTVREVFTVVGYIIGAAATTAVAGLYQSGFGWSTAKAYSGMGATFGFIAMALVLTTALNVKEKPSAQIEVSKMPALKAFLQTFKNKPFMQLIASFTITNISFTLLTTLMPYYLKYQLHMEDQMSFIMLALLVTIGVFLYPMKWVADHIGKGRAYALGLFIAALAITVAFFYPAEPTPLIYVTAVIAGIGLSSQWVCPWSMIPDVIEIDEAATGERREGIYYGMWNFITKFANAFAIASAGWMLALFGYVADAAQTTEALFGIRLLFTIVPAVMFIVGLPLLIWYPITRESHAKLLAELRAKRESEG